MPHALLALVLAASVQEEAVVRERKSFIPFRQYPAVGARQVMLLVTESTPMLRIDFRSGSPYCLSGGGSYWWITGVQDAAPIRAWGVKEKFALLEVEVNGGAGAREGEFTFRATNVKPLDGTPDYPIQAARAIAELEQTYEAFRKDREKDVEAGLEKGRQEAIRDGKATGPRSESTLLYATWMPKEERLRVRFLTRKVDGAYQVAGGSQTRSPEDSRYGPEWGVEYGMSYELDKSGGLALRERLPLETFRREKPKPPPELHPGFPPPR